MSKLKNLKQFQEIKEQKQKKKIKQSQREATIKEQTKFFNYFVPVNFKYLSIITFPTKSPFLS